MSDDPVIHGFDAPTGRRLKSGPDGNVLGTVYGIPAASDELTELLRKNLRELRAVDLEHVRKRRWLDTKTGEEFEHVKAFVDPVAPRDAGATAFALRDDSVLYLRPADAVEKVATIHVGEFRSWRA